MPPTLPPRTNTVHFHPFSSPSLNPLLPIHSMLSHNTTPPHPTNQSINSFLILPHHSTSPCPIPLPHPAPSLYFILPHPSTSSCPTHLPHPVPPLYLILTHPSTTS
ncbi:hypothetical protein Pcinc_014132 [Petrolisthes cinctipes]|uniref:Uncharacterized protein n=1 Tax=Petrolisthes cinctipes TaxID=88211 RepID=A0AAE1FVK0_PETCI|nr:hypothetical protein Pcinc_014132 [Petrolisthes cinctipes]